MGYSEDLYNCDSLEELFALWKNKAPQEISYTIRKQVVSRTINHRENYFIADGIVNDSVWNSGKKKRILFVLKEAYGVDWGDKTLATWLRDDKPKLRMWKRVARWTYGIQNTDANYIPRYVPELSDDMHGECLNQIAVINIKKSDGDSRSEYAEIDEYAKADREEIKKEFSLVDADIVVCGSTFKTLLHDVFERPELTNETACDNWYYYMNLDGKERLFIDAYHPANQWPDLMNYYTVTNIYQQALLDRKTK
ncbi:MAG: hypothetical protein IJ526_00945 [Lachnospiraceae bacterium]|nr:hypothetical protein [Lachnospiraceae bacterium]